MTARTMNVQVFLLDGDRIAWVGHDVTADRRREAALAEAVGRDPLTGLPDRIMWRDRLERALARTRRSHKGIGLMYLDLDDFKQVNDEFGHGFGDAVLREVARRIVGAVRPGDTVARVGGDEFVILCEDVPDVVVLEALGDRISRAIGGRPFQSAGHVAAMTCSVGVTFADAAATDVETFIRATDLAMYEAKRAGSGTPHRGILPAHDRREPALAHRLDRVPIVMQAVTDRAGGALVAYALDLPSVRDRSTVRTLQAIEEHTDAARAFCHRELHEALILLAEHPVAQVAIRIPMSVAGDVELLAALYARITNAGFPPRALQCCVTPRGARAERTLLALIETTIPVQLVVAGLGRYPVDLDGLTRLHPAVCEIDSDLCVRHPAAFLAARQLAAAVGAQSQCALTAEGVIPEVDRIRWLPGEILQPAEVASIEL